MREADGDSRGSETSNTARIRPSSSSRRRAAAFLGQEAAVFVPTASMANQIALRILTQPGDELLAEENAHVLINEQGGTRGVQRGS